MTGKCREAGPIPGRAPCAHALPERATLAALFAELAERYDPRFAALPDDEDSPFGVNAMILDGLRVAMSRDVDLELANGSELHLTPPIGGGQ